MQITLTEQQADDLVRVMAFWVANGRPVPASLVQVWDNL